MNGKSATVDAYGNWMAVAIPVLGRGTAAFDAVAAQSGGGEPAVATSVAPELPAMIVVMKHFAYYTSHSQRSGHTGTEIWIKNYEAQFAPGIDGQWRRSYQGTVTNDNTVGVSSSHTDYHWSHTNTVGTQHDVSDGVDYPLTPMDGTYYNDVLVKYVPDKSLDHEEYTPGYNTPVRYLVTHFWATGVKHRWDYPGGDFGEETLKARTDLKLFTGGKAKVARKSLIHISASAVEYGRPAGIPWYQTPGTSVAAARIQMLGWWLFGRQNPDPNGDLYLALPDNAAKNLNLRVKGAKHYDVNVSVAKLRLAAQRLSFTGHKDIQKDDGTGDYPTPHWETNETTRAVTSYPVLYVSGDRVLTETAFTNTVAGGGGDFPLIIKGVVSGGHTSFTLWGTNLNRVISACTVSTIADHPLTAAKVDFFQPMTIKWYYGYANKPDYLYAGTSTNQVFVSLKTPINGVALYHTVVNISCRNAAGQTTDGGAADAIFGEFTDRVVRRVSDNAQMTYWFNNQMGATETDGLLQQADANGNCQSWSGLLRDCFRVQGIPASRMRALPVSTNDASILVKNWQFNDPPTGTGSHPYIIGTDALDLNGVPGQGNPNPPGAFNGHWITLSNDAYYDPSYGTAKVTGANKDKNYEDGSLDGFEDGFGGARKNDRSGGSTSELDYQEDN